MQVHQNLSILFYRKKKKADKNGFMPLYCRVTVDGMEDEISTGCKVLFDDWDGEHKKVLSTHSEYKAFNKKITQMQTDLERHFDLVVAKYGLATPEQVFLSYKTPINGNQQKEEKKENALFSLELDEVIKEYIQYSRQVENLEKTLVFKQVKVDELVVQKKRLLDTLIELAERGQKIFDNKNWNKTLLLATDEYLLNFLQLVMADDRATNTLIKRWGSKKRMQEFMQLRFKIEDIPLSELQYKFLPEYIKYNKTQYKNSQNTLWKYAQILQEIMNRAVSNTWIGANIFGNYECKYVEPDDKKWPSFEEMIELINFKFEEKELADIRDIFVFQSFSGLSYAELYKLEEKHLVGGVDGKIWIDQRRRKTKSLETLPLLPICLDILDKFKNDPRCERTGKLLPVPTDQHYNRCLKLIGEKTEIPTLNNCHQARYVFANEIAYANGVESKTVAKLLGQKNTRSVDTYLKPSKKIISQSMQMVEEKLYGQDGPLSKLTSHKKKEAKVISLKKSKASNI